VSRFELGRSTAKFSSAWERWWFESIPPYSYALLRIAFGVLGLAILLGITPVDAFWSLTGLSPEPSPGGVRAWLIHSGFSELSGAAFFAVLAASFAAMAVGYKTRWSVLLCFTGSVVQTLWNRLPLSGANKAFIAVLFCLVWAESGVVWSIDAWLSRRRRVANVPVASTPVLPLRLLRFQLGFVYLNSGLWKLFGATWRDGTALHWAMSSNVFQRFPFAVPGTSDFALTAVTYLTLFWELSFVLLMLNRWTRRAALLMGVCVHVGTWLLMEVGPFSPVMLAAYIAFLEPADIERWPGRSPAAAVLHHPQILPSNLP
jgi:hypothetical protein